MGWIALDQRVLRAEPSLIEELGVDPAGNKLRASAAEPWAIVVRASVEYLTKATALRRPDGVPF
jgi:hypothetical protein